ncbi:hypothetical protein SDC9_204023 [bioreactor metagenome]|uniref:Uncharacterized protein n=1 Tax=bioreactor metagenome TaxID=1076179 RepID=A0A645IY18_9ZZZZ
MKRGNTVPEEPSILPGRIILIEKGFTFAAFLGSMILLTAALSMIALVIPITLEGKSALSELTSNRRSMPFEKQLSRRSSVAWRLHCSAARGFSSQVFISLIAAVCITIWQFLTASAIIVWLQISPSMYLKDGCFCFI